MQVVSKAPSAWTPFLHWVHTGHMSILCTSEINMISALTLGANSLASGVDKCQKEVSRGLSQPLVPRPPSDTYLPSTILHALCTQYQCIDRVDFTSTESRHVPSVNLVGKDVVQALTFFSIHLPLTSLHAVCTQCSCIDRGIMKSGLLVLNS